MPLRSSVYRPSSSRGFSLNDLRQNVQRPITRKSEVEAHVRPELVKCPELLLTGLELETRTTLQILHKKGQRFESPWKPVFVGIYANTLFYFINLRDWPRGVVPLVDAKVKAVDRIYRHGDAVSVGDDCGPCWKVTSSSGRVLLFRTPSHDARNEWIDQLRRATGMLQTSSQEGKAALTLARRLSRSPSAASSTVIMQSPKYHRENSIVENDLEQVDLLRRALRMVEKQRKEIAELQERLNESTKRMENEMQDRDNGGLASLDVKEEGLNVLASEKEAEQDEGGADGDELALDTMLDEAVIEVFKNFRCSAISDVLSEDDTPESDDGDKVKDDEDEGVYSKREGRREDIQSLSLVDESTEKTLGIEGEELIEGDYESMETETEVPGRYERQVSSKEFSGLDTTSLLILREQPTVIVPRFPQLVNVSATKKERSCAGSPLPTLIMEGLDIASQRKSSEKKSSRAKLKKSYSSIGIYDSGASAGNKMLQQQAMELAEIARKLQSSIQPNLKTLLKVSQSSSSLLESRSSFSDVTDFGLNDIKSNDSDESIFSVTQDELIYNGNDEGGIERLSEFEESDGEFLEASGFLDSIHQVMKDFIVSSESNLCSQPSKLVISDEIIAEIRLGIDAEPVEEVDDYEKAHGQCTLQADSPVAGLLNKSSSMECNLSSHARSARDFLTGDNDAAPRIILPQTSQEFSFLLIEDTMSVVASILQSSGREEKVQLLAPLLRVFGNHNRLSHLIRWAIEIEVASVINVATLFRSDDYASRLVSTYSKAIGSKFIRVALLHPIRQIYKLKIADMEINPHKEESLHDEAQVDTNAANLMQTCQHIIDSIMKNSHNIPSSYFHICSHLNSKVISRFKGTKKEDASMLTRSVIGGFLFLRFVCPAITTPHLYGLTKQLPLPETRRILVLVTKLLFKTATGVKFEDREPQLKVLNPFIEKNSPAIQQLFANLAMSPSQDINECFALDSRKIYSNVPSSQLVDDIETIRSICEKYLEEIGTKLQEGNCSPEVAKDFMTAVLYTTDSFQKSSLSKKLSANMKFLSNFGKKPRTRKESDQ